MNRPLVERGGEPVHRLSSRESSDRVKTQVAQARNMKHSTSVETSVTVNNNSPIQDYVHPDDQTQPTFEITPRFKPFTVL